jgi:5-methylcytosine-specific restriction endonuclease McrA
MGTYKMSKEWARTRRTHLMTYPECRACGTEDDVVVHHLRYKSGGRGTYERPGDLVTMCRSCHDDFHRHYPGSKGGLVEPTINYCKQVAATLASA